MKKELGAAANAANAPTKTSDVAAGAGVTTVLAPCEAAIEYRSGAELKPNPRNPRSHSGKQVQLLAAAIKEFGVFVPVVVDEKDVILAGHARLEAAKLLGMIKVPTIRVQHLTPERKRAFVLADNRLAELAGWDEEMLGAELGELSSLELDFELELTGFDTVDVDRLEAVMPNQAAEPEVAAELDRTEPTVSSLGDLWQLGPHRLFCGSALEAEPYRRVLGDEPVQMVFTDPPYNVPIDGHVGGLGSVKHAEFQMASGEMSEEEFIAFLASFMRLAAAHSVDGAIHFLCMDWRHMGEMLAAGRSVYGGPKNLCVWSKTNAGMGSFYRSQHELVFVFKVGTGKHINNFGLGERGRYRSNVWVYPGVNTFKRSRMNELEAHPTVKPLAMVIDALKDCSRRRGIVLDPFVGSGTTLLAAEKTGRVCRALELDPHYVDVAIRRWQALTGQSAVHLSSGRTFDELAAERRKAA
jgi:DNA modification methylase